MLFNPIDDWRDVESNITQMVLITGIYLFSWDGIQGNDNEIFKKFLKKNFGIDWGKNAKIEKMDDGKTIQLSTGKNYLSLTLNDEKTKANLEIDNVKTAEYTIKKVNNKLKIYKKVFKGKLDFLYFAKDLYFIWDEKDEWRLIKFLKQNYSIDWVKTAKIEKTDDGKTIQLSTGKNYLSLTLNDEKTKISLKIDDGRTDELILRTGKEVYKEGSNVAFGEEIDMKAFQEIKVVWGFTKKIDDLYEKGILGDFSHRVLHEAYEVRNKIHDPSIVSPFSEQDLILFHNASLVTHGILQAIQIERGEDISTSLKSISTNLKNGAEELAKQCLL
ncbi:MAG: hypothetical protein MPEBLZ_04292 [Candidatus Methanoperedens nitroreducens]|uniref:Uncharacterized protein n=1 Tax=Candidatus Methanoperedens nitratireducens TaxID=1392998 RepID=A0A0P8CF87_9EURY|nr:MAG: hypothetical protein MPEBLZ_04292 [Candidatus Methanoperedens sp. BLZ1]